MVNVALSRRRASGAYEFVVNFWRVRWVALCNRCSRTLGGAGSMTASQLSFYLLLTCCVCAFGVFRELNFRILGTRRYRILRFFSSLGRFFLMYTYFCFCSTVVYAAISGYFVLRGAATLGKHLYLFRLSAFRAVSSFVDSKGDSQGGV